MSVQSVFPPPIPQSSAALPIKASIITSTTVTTPETSPRSVIQDPSESPITDSPVNNVSRQIASTVRHKVATNKVTPGPRSGPQRSSISVRPSAGHSVTPQGTRPPRFVPSQSHSNSLHQSQSQPHITPVESNHSDHSSHSPINANHLLNFTYAPRGHNAADAERSRNTQNHSVSTKAKQSNRFHLGNKLFFNKELFILANSQLVVRDLGSEEANALVYSIHNLDPDRPVDWDLIELIRFHSNAKPHCPICLFPPDAAKITRCGHIYCHPCILHYLSLADDALLAPADAVARCPICSDPVSASDLKSVEIVSGHEYKVGDQLSMHLMRRPRGSLAAYPVHGAPPAAPAPKS